MERATGLHREPLERVRQQREREPADPVAGEHELDLRMRAAHEVDGGRRARLVHRHRRGAVARDSVPVAERGRERVAERGEHVLDRVVLVDVEVAAGEQLEVEAGVEGEQRQQVIEEADPGRDARPAGAVEVERDASAPSRCSCGHERRPAGAGPPVAPSARAGRRSRTGGGA